MSVGSCFSCKFCNTQIAIHNHSSFIHHERHCLLNPSVAAASSVLRQHHSIAEYHSIGEFPNTHTAIHASKKAGHNEGHPEKHSLLKPHVVVASSVLRGPHSNGELENNQSTSTMLKKAKLNHHAPPPPCVYA
jgi:hypothetical protein